MLLTLLALSVFHVASPAQADIVYRPCEIPLEEGRGCRRAEGLGECHRGRCVALQEPAVTEPAPVVVTPEPVVVKPEPVVVAPAPVAAAPEAATEAPPTPTPPATVPAAASSGGCDVAGARGTPWPLLLATLAFVAVRARRRSPRPTS